MVPDNIALIRASPNSTIHKVVSRGEDIDGHPPGSSPRKEFWSRDIDPVLPFLEHAKKTPP